MFESSALMGHSQTAAAVDHHLKLRIQFNCDKLSKVDKSEEQKINEAGIFIYWNKPKHNPISKT